MINVIVIITITSLRFFGKVVSRARIKPGIVVPSNDDFVLVREGGEPVELGLEFGDSAAVGQVAGMNEEVAVRDGGGGVVMRIGDTDYSNGRIVLGGGRETAEAEKDVMDENDRKAKGCGEDKLECRRWLEDGA